MFATSANAPVKHVRPASKLETYWIQSNRQRSYKVLFQGLKSAVSLGFRGISIGELVNATESFLQCSSSFKQVVKKTTARSVVPEAAFPGKLSERPIQVCFCVCWILVATDCFQLRYVQSHLLVPCTSSNGIHVRNCMQTTHAHVHPHTHTCTSRHSQVLAWEGPACA